MKRLLLFLLCVFCFFGCAKLTHLDQLLTLKAVSEEKEEIDEYVRARDEQFELLLASVESDNMAQYQAADAVLIAFGEPIRKVSGTGFPIHERWIYRYQTRYFKGPKVYLDFDQQQRLIHSEIISAPNQKAEEPTAATD